MDKKIIFFFFFLFFAFKICSQPSIGTENTLEICNWNIEWFGKKGNFGPLNDSLQQQNILKTIKNSDIDIWALCEVSNKIAFDSMMKNLPEYDYKISPYFPEQKTAFIYKKSMFKFVSENLLGTQNPDSFSTLRYPFEIGLVPNKNLTIDTLFLIAIHLKANTGTSSEKLLALESRKKSSEWLKMYLNKTHKNHYCMVLGDWNDDLDVSIYNSLTTPFSNLLDPVFNFKFVTKHLTDNNISTTVGFSNPIDHQLVSNKLATLYQDSSVTSWNLSNYFDNYSSTTSDHYPVYSIYKNLNSGLVLNGLTNFNFYPNPAQNVLTFDYYNSNDLLSISIFDIKGKLILKKDHFYNNQIDITHIENGLYILKIVNKNFSQTSSLIIQK